jgi:hypothetical protein
MRQQARAIGLVVNIFTPRVRHEPEVVAAAPGTDPVPHPRA